MNFRIVRDPEAFQVPSKQPRRKDHRYLAWLHELPCVVTGARPVEAAHLNFAAEEYGHFGRGKGQKAGDEWCLPLSPDQHRRQHTMSERDYWRSTGINPHVLALALFRIFSDGHDASFGARCIAQHRSRNNG